MVKRRFAPKRRYRRASRAFRRVSRTKIPFEMGIAGIAIPFTAPADGWSTPMTNLQDGDMNTLLSGMKKGFLGMNPDGSIDIMGLLNPFDLGNARYTKMLMYAGLVGKVRKRFVPQSSKLIGKIPLVGRMFS